MDTMEDNELINYLYLLGEQADELYTDDDLADKECYEGDEEDE